MLIWSWPRIMMKRGKTQKMVTNREESSKRAGSFRRFSSQVWCWSGHSWWYSQKCWTVSVPMNDPAKLYNICIEFTKKSNWNYSNTSTVCGNNNQKPAHFRHDIMCSVPRNNYTSFDRPSKWTQYQRKAHNDISSGYLVRYEFIQTEQNLILFEFKRYHSIELIGSMTYLVRPIGSILSSFITGEWKH